MKQQTVVRTMQAGLCFGAAIAILLATLSPAHAGWGEDALVREANYICDSSFTQYSGWYLSHISSGGFSPTSKAYGVINDYRVNAGGPDFVRIGEGAMAAVGLIQAVKQLRASNSGGAYTSQITRYDNVLSAYFRTYVLSRTTDSGGNHFQILQDGSNGVYDGMQYYADGSTKGIGSPNIGVTSQMLVAMWKYAEYQSSMGQNNYRDDAVAWDFISRAASYVSWDGRFNSTYLLVSNDAGGWMWTSDNAFVVPGLQCAAKWAQVKGLSSSVYQPWLNRAANVQKGLLGMMDNGGWKGFYRLRKSDGSVGYTANDSEGRVVDQTCFAPYETNAMNPIAGFSYPAGGSQWYPASTQLSNWTFAKSISDFWTDGNAASGFPGMTDKRNDWRFYGTNWHRFVDHSDYAENHQIYPGPGLQLAKVEWKCATAQGLDSDTNRNTAGTAAYRANKRFRWANTGDATGSNLWYGGGSWNPFNSTWNAGNWTYGYSYPSEWDQGIPNGIIDWRDADNYYRAANEWDRYVDTSAYFIEVTLMNIWRTDTRYTP